ncbi:MAG: outer membrane lipoprotein carrier protein LolA [Balneolaceae bacterium]|nr:outer membrane lipoprotein carrier protein LolA [Balneolaceae bacterium]
MLAITFPLLAGVITSTADAQDTPFDQLINRFREGQIYRAEFNHQYVDSYTADTVSRSGTIWVGRDKYKIQNSRQTVVVDGETSRVYDKNRNRVIVSKYEPEEDDFAPSRFLDGTDTTYVVERQVAQEGGTMVVLVSSDPFSIFQRVEITISNDLVPLKIFARDQADNLITTTFRNGAFTGGRENLFALDYPKQAEVIDMRN